MSTKQPPFTGRHQVFRFGDATVLKLDLSRPMLPEEVEGLLSKLALHHVGAECDGALLTVYMPRGHTFITKPSRLEHLKQAMKKDGPSMRLEATARVATVEEECGQGCTRHVGHDGACNAKGKPS